MIYHSITSSAFATTIFFLAHQSSVAYSPKSIQTISQSQISTASNNHFHVQRPLTSQKRMYPTVGTFPRTMSTTSSSRKSLALSVGNWWEDDLPNILGINPFEAALIFGALYKFYGPGVLYEFAREAGKLFSTYAPIIRDLSLDIFNEGKDYLEEDRDRELMRKGGVDIENMPRKTTNIIERFQAGMEAQELAAKGNPDDDTVSTVEKSIAAVSATRSAERAAKKKTKQLAMAGGEAEDAEEYSLDSMEGGRRRRKSKKEVLIEKDVDIEKVIQGSKDKLNLEENALAKNLNEMQQRFTDFQQAAEARAAGTGTVGSTPSLNSGYTSGDDYFDAEAGGGGGGGYNDMTAFAKMTAASAGGAMSGSALGSQMSAALAESNTLNSAGAPGRYAFPSDYPSDRDGDFPAEMGMTPFAGAANGAVKDTSGMSKFQLQMSGQWNQQVMGKESGSGSTPISLDGPNPYAAAAAVKTVPSGERLEGGREYGGRETYDQGLGLGGDFEYGDMTDSFTARRPDNLLERTRGRGAGRDGFEDRRGRGVEGSGLGSNGLPDVPPEWLSVSSDEGGLLPITGDIPMDLSADDEPLYASNAAEVGAIGIGMDGQAGRVGVVGTSALVVEVLKELDRDYMALRSRLVDLIEQQVPSMGMAIGAEDTEGVALKVIGHEGLEESVAGMSGAMEGSDISIGGKGEGQGHGHAEVQGVEPSVDVGSGSGSESPAAPVSTTRMKYWPTRQLVSI